MAPHPTPAATGVNPPMPGSESARGHPPCVRPILMGIVNITPDSFSGDGRLGDAAVAAADHLVEAGADWLDLGAESTRPHQGATAALGADEEWQRLQAVLHTVAGRPWRQRVRISIDTRHAETAARALGLGADLINDVGGLADPAMLAVLATSDCDVVVMHALSVPADPARTLPVGSDVLAAVSSWKSGTAARAAAAGIDPGRLVFDPGIGFGKSAEQSLDLVSGADRLVANGGRWLFGHSRKSFLKLFTEAEAGAPARDDLTLALSAQLAAAGVQVLRVHAVQRHAQLFERLRAAALRDGWAASSPGR